MRTIIMLLSIIIILGTISCGSSPKESKIKVVEDIYKPIHTAQQITENLEFAYKHKEPVFIGNFFSEWQENVKPNTIEFIHQNETTAAIYNVFNTFYRPNDLLKIGNWASVDDINLNCKYIVIQNQIVYSIINSSNINEVDWNITKNNLISNFRPPISSNDNYVLYLTEEYAESLNNFLVAEIKQTGDNQMNIPSKDYRVEKHVKAEFLRSYIPAIYDYPDQYWHFETHPYINKITLNKSMNKAKIDFCIGQQIGEVILENKGKGWAIKESLD